jgi:hypothetical protein
LNRNKHLKNITGYSLEELAGVIKAIECNLNLFYGEGPKATKVHHRVFSQSILINTPRDFVFSWEEILDSQRSMKKALQISDTFAAPFIGDLGVVEEAEEDFS